MQYPPKHELKLQNAIPLHLTDALGTKERRDTVSVDRLENNNNKYKNTETKMKIKKLNLNKV